MIVLRSLVSVVLRPGVLAVLIPWRIARPPAWRASVDWVGIVPLAFGPALFGRCLITFASRARGTLAPWEAPRRFVAVLALVWHAFVALWDGPSLERTFGDEYRAYRAGVPRWLPRLP